jgi:SAM-dependent methyltransferase
MTKSKKVNHNPNGNGSVNPAMPFDCHACGAEKAVSQIRHFTHLRRVTSDCKPWPPGGNIGACRACGLIQKPADKPWLEESSQIYKAYSIYHQGGGKEPAIYVGGFERQVARSVQLFRNAIEYLNLKNRGRMLDVGCGNGAALRTIGPMLPNWTLEGTEIDDKYRADIEAIPGVVKCHVGPPSDDLGPYDLITLIHVLEHVGEPREILKWIHEILHHDGILLVVVPAINSNPFDLVVADHCSHFDTESLQNLFYDVGFESVYINEQWMSRQLTAIARRGGSRSACEVQLKHRGLEIMVDWLRQVREDAAQKAKAADGPFGIFGSSNNAVWLAGELNEKVDFFVDEDRSRVGRKLLDKPIIGPEAVPPGNFVYVAVPFPWCAEISARLSGGGARYFIPPRISKSPEHLQKGALS